jgi:hypothetical protein
MKIGDIVTVDPYWRSPLAGFGRDPTGREGQRGVVLGFIVTGRKRRKKVVVHLFDESREYFYYSPQHIRPYECPNYKGFNDESR